MKNRWALALLALLIPVAVWAQRPYYGGSTWEKAGTNMVIDSMTITIGNTRPWFLPRDTTDAILSNPDSLQSAILNPWRAGGVDPVVYPSNPVLTSAMLARTKRIRHFRMWATGSTVTLKVAIYTGGATTAQQVTFENFNHYDFPIECDFITVQAVSGTAQLNVQAW